MVFSKHPVPAALFMITSLVGVAALFVLLEAFFLAILQVLVYAGAVMVLFLFIIMLLDRGPEGEAPIKCFRLAGSVAAGLLVILLNFVLQTGLNQTVKFGPPLTNPPWLPVKICFFDCGEELWFWSFHQIHASVIGLNFFCWRLWSCDHLSKKSVAEELRQWKRSLLIIS